MSVNQKDEILSRIVSEQIELLFKKFGSGTVISFVETVPVSDSKTRISIFLEDKYEDRPLMRVDKTLYKEALENTGLSHYISGIPLASCPLAASKNVPIPDGLFYLDLERSHDGKACLVVDISKPVEELVTSPLLIERHLEKNKEDYRINYWLPVRHDAIKRQLTNSSPLYVSILAIIQSSFSLISTSPKSKFNIHEIISARTRDDLYQAAIKDRLVGTYKLCGLSVVRSWQKITLPKKGSVGIYTTLGRTEGRGTMPLSSGISSEIAKVSTPDGVELSFVYKYRHMRLKVNIQEVEDIGNKLTSLEKTLTKIFK